MTSRFAARVLPVGLLVATLTGGPSVAHAGAYSFTVEPIDPLTQSTPDLFVGIYFDFLLTNTSSQPDSFHLVVDNITNVDFFGQVCIGATCFPFATTIFVDAFSTEIIGVNLAPFVDGSSDADLHVTSIGDPGLVYDETVTLYAGEAATGVQELLAQASPLSLAQNVPNPVRRDTRIAYALSTDASVTLRIFDVSGRVVRTLADGVRGRGIHDAVWDGLDERGLPLASGVYFYRLDSSQGSLTKQLTLIR
jgi:hypothetical protein